MYNMYILVGGLEHEFYDFPYIGNNHPNWLVFFRGVGQPPTSSGWSLIQEIQECFKDEGWWRVNRVNGQPQLLWYVAVKIVPPN